MMMENEILKKYHFISDNVLYILAPYIIIEEKMHVSYVNERKIRKIPHELVREITDFLVCDTSMEEHLFYKKVLAKKMSKDYMNSISDTMYIAMKSRNYQKFAKILRIDILDWAKKVLKKNNDVERLYILNKYYDIEEKEG